jgi:Ser/Thr protein kinase RdoA (MazF antagonist)
VSSVGTPGDEEVLAGGNLTDVVRVGATVRRTAGRWTPLVHELLRHVRGRGFALAPEPHGIDELGREVLEFLPGDVASSAPWPRWVWSESLLVQAGEALASYHRAVADFRPEVVTSRLGTWPLGDDEVVCHNDFAPYNCVVVDGRLVGVLDWDVVCAGRPLCDVAFASWHWVPLHAPSRDLEWRTPEVAARRLRTLVDAYGPLDEGALVDEVLARIESSRRGVLERAAAGDPAFVRLERAGHAKAMAAACRYVTSNARTLRDALVR